MSDPTLPGSSSADTNLNVLEQQRRLEEAQRRDYGPLVMRELNNDATLEIQLNPDGSLYADRIGEGNVRIGTMSVNQAMRAILGTAKALGVVVSYEHPVLEGQLPLTGSRIEALIPPVVAAPTFAIRKHAKTRFRLTDYVAQGSLTEAQREGLRQAIVDQKNILVVGATKTGKTTFCNAVLAELAELDPTCRMVVIEDTPELQVDIERKVMIQTTATFTISDALKATMRLSPERITVGEVRDKAALGLCKAWGTGHPGGVSTVHADDGRGALNRIEQLIAEGGAVPSRELIAAAINVVVVLRYCKAQRRRYVSELVAVTGVEQGEYVLAPL